MSEKVTLQSKLKYIENKIQKQCSLHKCQSTVFCLKFSCIKCPYICSQCIRENTHGHSQQIYELNDFIRKICLIIEDNKRKMNNILEGQDKNYQWIIKQQLKVLDSVQLLQGQLASMIQDFKKKIQIAIDKAIHKNNFANNIRFYSNPNLLVNKIISDASFSFINQLKQGLINTERYDSSDQGQLQLNDLKNKIRELILISNTSSIPKHVRKQSQIKPTIKQTFLLNDYPIDIFATFQNILISMPKQTYCFNILQKTKSYSIPTLILKASKSNLINDTSFITMSSLGFLSAFNQNKPTKTNQISSRVTALGFLASYSKNYALLGYQDGAFEVLDIEGNQIVYRSYNQQSKITSIQSYQRNTIILCCRQNSTVDVFKYRHQYESFVFEFQNQFFFKFSPILFIKVYEHELILFGSCRNILIYDLMLNCEVMRSNFIEKSPDFTHSSLISSNPQTLILTLSSGERALYLWSIDRSKKTMNVNPLYLQLKDNKQGQIKGIQYSNDSLWVIQDGQKCLFSYSLDSQNK